MVTGLHIARGDVFDVPTAPTTIPSPIREASADEWSNFVRAMATQAITTISDSLGLGWFDVRYRRLGDLGLVTNLRRITLVNGRQSWTGDFVLPLSRNKFLKSPVIQYNVFVCSMVDYLSRLAEPLPKGVSRSGALAILHRAGPNGLKSWNTSSQFEDTIRLLNRTNGIF